MSATRQFAVSDFFIPSNGKAKYTLDFVDAHQGEYPVYSASLRGIFGFVDEYEYDGTYLTWVMNGYGGRIQEVSGRFSANRDRGVLVPRDGVKIPDLTYLRFALEPSLINLRVGRIVDGRLNEYTKIYPPAAKDAEIRIPVDQAGEPDYELMLRIGRRLRVLEQKQHKMRLARDELRRATVLVPVEEPYRMVSLGDRSLFTLSIGDRILRSENVGEGVPVYSANVRVPFGYSKRANQDDFSSPSLLWGIDTEVFDWNLFEADDEFSMTDHIGRLQLKTESIDLQYLLYALKSRRTRPGFDRVFRASLRNVRDEIEVPIPLDEVGNFSIDRQRELASVYRRVEHTQVQALGALDDVLAAKLGGDLLATIAVDSPVES